MRPISSTLVCLLFAVVLPGQQTHVLPNGAESSPGSGANTHPWGTSLSGSPSPGIRDQSVYDSSNLTNAGNAGNARIDYPIEITGLRWRANDSARTWVGGTYANATVSLSTAAVDYTAVSPNWAANHGADLTLCHSGPVVVQPGFANGPGLPGPFHVDVTLTTPFVYDPTQGDLCIDCDWQNGTYSGGTLTPLDVDTSATGRASRVFASSQYPNANGTTQNHGLIVELTYVPATPDIATAFPYGRGCYDGYSSFYELFPASSFDLSNSGISLLPTSIGYLALSGAGAWHVPTSMPTPMAGNGVTAAQALGFMLNYPGGSTSAIHISSNGFVWAAPNFANGCCVPTPGEFLAQAARWAPLWVDLDPSSSGVHFDVDAASGAAYVTFVNVPEAGLTTSPNLNSFQIAFFATGRVEYRYQQCTITDHVTLVGWTPGSGARNPGPSDLSVALPIVTQHDAWPPVLAANGRPIINSSVPLVASNLPPTSPIGAFFLGLTQYDPGLALGSFGMLGCHQFASLDASVAFVPQNGSGSFSFPVPNDPTFAGVHIYCQAASMLPGVNVLGVLGSNGVDLAIGTQ